MLPRSVCWRSSGSRRSQLTRARSAIRSSCCWTWPHRAPPDPIQPAELRNFPIVALGPFLHSRYSRGAVMWPGFDPQIRRQLENVRHMVALAQQTPTREWPLIFEGEHNELLVVREWPDGSVTAYLTAEYSDTFRDGDK